MSNSQQQRQHFYFTITTQSGVKAHFPSLHYSQTDEWKTWRLLYQVLAAEHVSVLQKFSNQWPFPHLCLKGKSSEMKKEVDRNIPAEVSFTLSNFVLSENVKFGLIYNTNRHMLLPDKKNQASRQESIIFKNHGTGKLEVFYTVKCLPWPWREQEARTLWPQVCK